MKTHLTPSESEVVIRQIIQTVHSSLDTGEVFPQIVQSLGNYLKADRCFISRYNANTQELSPPTHEYRSSTQIESILTAHSQLWKLSCQFAHTLCQSHHPVEFDGRFSDEIQTYLDHFGVKSGLGCAVIYQGQCKAVIFIHQVTNSHTWTDSEKEMIEIVSNQTAVAIHQSDLYKKLEARACQRGILSEFNRKALLGTKLPELLQHAVNAIQRALTVPYAMILEHVGGNTPQQSTLLVRAVEGFEAELAGRSFSTEEIPEVGKSLESLQPLFITDWNRDPRFTTPSSLAHEYGIISSATMVIYGSERAFGALEAASTTARVFDDDELEFLQAIANVLSISVERQEAEQALQESEERFRSTFAYASIGMALTTTQGQFLQVNPSYCTITGYSEEELYTMDATQITHPDDIERSNTLNQQLFSEHIPGYVIETRYIKKDKSIVWVQNSVSLIRGRGNRPNQLITLTEDISERKKAEQQSALYALKLEYSNRDLEQFATIASHDLQAPLRKAKLFGDYLHKTCFKRMDPEAQDSLLRLQKSITTMQNLIEDLLTVAKVSSQELTLQSINAGEFIRSLLKDFKDQLREKQARIELGPFTEIEGDATQLRQLLQNLISNALKFQKPGIAPNLHIYTLATEEEYHIVVADNGIGFKAEYAERIFNTFERLHGNSCYPGTGIGLAICKRIVERHGGSIIASSEPDKGSQFTVTLPKRLHHEKQATPKQTPSD